MDNFRDRVRIERDGGVAHVRLTRADKMNALDADMFVALNEASDSLAKDLSLRAVVLSGDGRSFCAGLDFASFMAMSSETGAPTQRLTEVAEGRITHYAQQAVYGWTSLPVPVIAAIHGHALGGGIQLALGADIRIVHPEATMSVLEIRWGLIPDMTGTQQLVDLVGLDVAKELTWTGRNVSGREAVDLGLATRLSDDPVADALAMASDVAQRSPHAIRAAKRLFAEARHVDRAEGFRREREEIGRLVGSPNQAESVKAFFEKRTAVFTDPEF